MKLYQTILFIFSIPMYSSAHIDLYHQHPLKKNSSFEQTWKRYPSPDILMNRVESFIQIIDPTARQYVINSLLSCSSTSLNGATLGENNPITGLPTTPKPGASLFVWNNQCIGILIKAEQEKMRSTVDELAKSQKTESAIEILKTWISSDIIETCVLNSGQLTSNPSLVLSLTIDCSTEYLSLSQQYDIVVRLIEELIGPDEVIRELFPKYNLKSLAELILNTTKDSSKMNIYPTYLQISTTTITTFIFKAKYLVLTLDSMRY